MLTNWPTKKILSVDKGAAKLRIVIWIKLQNSEKVYKQLFLEKNNYFMFKTGQIKGELGVERANVLKS